MKAEVAYQVANELSKQELERLLSMLQVDVATFSKRKINNIKKKQVITDKNAINYLLKNIFNCNQ